MEYRSVTMAADSARKNHFYDKPTVRPMNPQSLQLCCGCYFAGGFQFCRILVREEEAFSGRCCEEGRVNAGLSRATARGSRWAGLPDCPGVRAEGGTVNQI